MAAGHKLGRQLCDVSQYGTSVGVNVRDHLQRVGH